MAKFAVAPAGFVADTIITALDIPIIIICAVPLVCGQRRPHIPCENKDVDVGILTFLLWYPFSVAAIFIWPREMYQTVFGKETGIFRNNINAMFPDRKA